VSELLGVTCVRSIAYFVLFKSLFVLFLKFPVLLDLTAILLATLLLVALILTIRAGAGVVTDIVEARPLPESRRRGC